ncbi:MAG: lipocalin [Lentisphaerae bacterium]|nr:lipocalin [Lentisphaerota bacterium]
MKNRTDEIPAVSNFELPRYMGTWYEIARYPHSFEKGLHYVTADYSVRSDGKIRVLNRGVNEKGKVRVAEGVAVPNGKPGTGELKVSFFRPFYGAYRVIYLSPDYDLAIVTSSTKDYLWILSRRKQLTEKEKTLCLEKLAEWGFDPAKLIMVDQN